MITNGKLNMPDRFLPLSYGTDEYGVNVRTDNGRDLFRIEADEGVEQDEVIDWLVPMLKAINNYNTILMRNDKLRQAAMIGMGTMITVLENFKLDSIQREELTESLAIVENTLGGK